MRSLRWMWTGFSLPVVFGVAGVVVSCGGGDELPAVEGATSPRLDTRAAQMAFDPDAIAVAAGQIEVVLRNEDLILHDLRIEDQPFVLEAAPGQTAAAKVVLEKGSYRIYCSLPGHREAGMEGVLEVR